MLSIRKKVIVVALFTLCSVNAFGSDTGRQGGRGGKQGPPPEAYAACEDKAAGDSAEFTSPRGDTISGTCEQAGDRLVLRPENSKGESGGRTQGPPPEAYTACEDKAAGDSAGFTSPRGDTISGTCEQAGGGLVLRPENSKGESGGRTQGPPPEAYTACEDKAAGDSAEFTSPRGDTVSGTCEQDGDRLVLRPDRRRMN